MKKTIKKISLYTLTLAASVLLVSTASSAQVVSTQVGLAGTTVTIPDTNGSGPDLTYNPSPGVVVLVSSTDNAYAITAMNGSPANGDRNEYGIWSNNTGYYQGVNPTTANSPALVGDLAVQLDANTTLTTSPFTGSTWTNMGGGS